MSEKFNTIIQSFHKLWDEIAETNKAMADYFRDNTIIDEKAETVKYIGNKDELVKLMVEGMFYGNP